MIEEEGSKQESGFYAMEFAELKQTNISPRESLASYSRSDEKRIVAAQKGTSSALEKLLTRHRTTVYRTARRFVVNVEDVDDLVQETMLRAFVNIGKLRSEARFSSWLVAIVINAARSSKRKSKHFHWLYLDEIQESEDRRQAWVVPDTLNELERSGGIGLVMLGRPYHHDPGLNQGILEELQQLGYSIFSQSLLPLDTDLLERLSGAEVQAGLIRSPPDISDVWKHTFSASSNHKIWAAKFVARHPNLISVELSNFKCGHDAFISRVVEQLIAQSGKPHFSFRDLDENRPWPLPAFALRQCTTSSDITGNNLRKVRALLLDPEQHGARRPHVWAQQRCASERKVRGVNDPFYEMAHIYTPKQKTTFSRGIASQH